MPGFCNLLRHEAVINRHAEDKRVAGGEAPFELVEILEYTLILNDLVLDRVLITLVGGFLRKVLDDVRPFGLWAVSLSGHRLDAITDPSAGIDAHRPFHSAFVVVNEKT